MNKLKLLTVTALVLVSALTSFAKSKEEKQAEARKKADQVLARLYKASPSAQAQISSAAGYAVFSNAGMKILVAGGGKGQGIAVDNATEKRCLYEDAGGSGGIGNGSEEIQHYLCV